MGRRVVRWAIVGSILAGVATAAAVQPIGGAEVMRAAAAIPAAQSMPALVYDPHPEVLSYLLFWVEDRGGGGDIFAKRLHGNGLPQGGAAHRGWQVIAPRSGDGSHGPRMDPAAAYNPAQEEFLLVYSESVDDRDGWDIYSLRISPAGYARGAPRKLAGGRGDQRRPDVALLGDASGSGDYLVVYEDNSRDVDEVWAIRVQANGIARSKPYELVRGGSDASDPTTSGGAVVWVDNRSGQRDLFLLRLRNGLPSGTATPVTGDVLEEFNPRFGSDGLVWNVYQPLTGVDVMGVEIIENSRSRGQGAILVPAADQLCPDMDNGVVVFADNRTGDFDLYAIRAVVRGRARALGHDYEVLTDR